MTTQNNNAPSNSAPVAAAPPQAPALSAADIQKLVAEGVAQAISADRTRSAAIRTCEEAKGREKLADHLALNTSMSIDDAKAILAASPKEAEPPKAGRQEPNHFFASAMDHTQNPNVGADPEAGATGPGGEPADPVATANRLLGNYGVVTGRNIETATQH